MKIDLLIENALVLTMTGPGAGALPQGAVAVCGNRIAAVGPAAEILPAYRSRAERILDGSGRVLMPGLIDGHIHTMLGLFRGLAQDMQNWMEAGLTPFLAHLTEEVAIKGAALNALEALKAGTTTLVDYGFPMRVICDFYRTLGVRARVAGLINEIPMDLSGVPAGELYPFNPDQGQLLLYDNLALIEEWHGAAGGRISCMFGPQGPDMVSRELLLEIKALAEKHDVMIHMHVAQGERETRQVEKRYGKRPIAFLDEIGYLNSRLLAVHLTDATAQEAARVAASGAAMACCPGSIAIIDGIVPPLVEFLEAGGRAALGSDQAPGNNCNNMWNEMKLAALLNKVRYRDPAVMPAWKALRLATVEAAAAVGLGSQIGSLEQGKLADMILIDLRHPNLAPHLEYPARNIVPNLVYSARGHEVETVIIDGQIVVEEGKVLTVDPNTVVAEAQAAAEEMAQQASSGAAQISSGPVEMTRRGLI